MKHAKTLQDWARDNGVRLDTVSFYQNLEGEQSDSEFYYCEILGVKTMVSWCIAATNENKVIEFQVAEELIGGALGRAAGAL